ncbi:hypothetical protein P775_23745 [Puniceibacterium antarcticum]|uniref:Uncharacterized protein n=1 Tax=Puniceibacterium antarcticum TaxID=1206336 RepID=A0A2G8R944_9RHOB|nr:hypothetical protein [Puniceibacterium antarcticum]PIL17668.1 hypothetical protein P775_23745 [Puniceibacterium antarcticum]
MQHILRLLTALSLMAALALPASAQPPMSGPEFDAYATGKTLVFGQDGQSYGVEQYLPDRRVRWSFMDGDCTEGRWYEAAGQICFLYDGASDPQCWAFFKEDSGLRAVFENTQDGTNLYEARQQSDPMLCYGPKTGV